MKNILLVEDDESLNMGISFKLRKEGMNVFSAKNLEDGKRIFDSERIELIILDIGLPDGNGFDFCSEVRKNSDVLIIFLTARYEEIDIVTGLDMGADDYITKPFSAMELIARIKSNLRRYKKYTAATQVRKNVIEIGNLTINTDSRQVFIGDKEARLTPKEFDILELLARNKGIVFSIEKIYERVWGEEFYKSDGTVMVHITKIREKIEEDPKKPIYIKTVWGVGYKI